MLLLGEKSGGDFGLLSTEVRIGLPHLRYQHWQQLGKEYARGTELVTVTNRATDDTAKDIAATLVTWHHPIRDQKGTGAKVIGNHPQGFFLEIRYLQSIGNRLDERLKQVNLVIGMDALKYCGNALEPHAGVHRRCGKRMELTFAVPIELHKHQVPDFDVAIKIIIGTAGWSPGYIGTMIIEDL